MNRPPPAGERRPVARRGILPITVVPVPAGVGACSACAGAEDLLALPGVAATLVLQGAVTGLLLRAYLGAARLTDADARPHWGRQARSVDGLPATRPDTPGAAPAR